jgi:transposase
MESKKQNTTKQAAKVLDFTGEIIFVGIDVHKKSWKVTLYFHGMELRTISMDPDPKGLVNFLFRNYPNASRL